MDHNETEPKAGADRRAFLKTAGKAAIIVPPAMTALLSTTMASPAIAASGGGGSSRVHGNNGVGNGYDPQPPGNPPPNDTGPNMGPGNPDRKGGG